MPAPAVAPIILGVLAFAGLALASKKKDSTSLPSQGGGIQPIQTDVRSPGISPVSQSTGRVMPVEMQEMVGKVLAALRIDASGKVTPPVSPEAIQMATGLAAQLEAAGFPEAAGELRKIAKASAKAVPPPPPAQQIPIPAIPAELQTKVNRAIQLERDPKVLRAIAAELRKLPVQDASTRNAIEMLEVLAAQFEAAQATTQVIRDVDTVIKSPGVPQPSPVSPLPPPVTPLPSPTPIQPAPATPLKSKEQLKAERLVSHLRQLQASGDMKRAKAVYDKALVMSFQAQEGMTQDGKPGPGTTLAMAKYVGVLPLVMFWPASSTAKTVLAYRVKVNDLADDAEAQGNTVRAAELRSSASRERGQGGIVGAMPA